MPEICWEEIAEKILFVFRFDVWPGTGTLAFRLISFLVPSLFISFSHGFPIKQVFDCSTAALPKMIDLLCIELRTAVKNVQHYYIVCVIVRNSPQFSITCVGLLDVKPGFVYQVGHKNEIWKKNISLAISSQQISGKNSENK